MARGVYLKKNGEKYYPAPYMPIGSIYLTVSNVNPSTYFGGTWEKLSGGYIYCADSTIEKTTYTGWGTQGHTLTNAQLPKLTGSFQSRQAAGMNVLDVYSGGGIFTYTDQGGSQWSNQISSLSAAGSNNKNALITLSIGNNQAHSHNIATIDVFMWKRIA